MCQIAVAIEERLESAVDAVDGSRHRHRTQVNRGFVAERRKSACGYQRS